MEIFFSALLQTLLWPTIGYLFLGVFIGLWLGAIPGLGGIIGLVLLLPFTFGLDPIPAFALLLGMYAITTTSDTIASVMLGVPGTAASQATVLEGYPLAKQGHAARALGAAFTVSAFGGVFGAIALAASLPIIRPVILAFGSPELFMLGVLGLAMVGSLSGAYIARGLTVAAFGLLLSTIGYAETDAIPRYWFGTDYLIEKLPLIPVVLGLFAVPEIMELATRNVSISRVAQNQTEGGGLFDGVRDAFSNWWLATRCAALGTYVGILPGMGGAIVDWVAYGHAVQSAKDKSKFGQGDIRGVIAPEAANNATKGGSLIPTVAFGIPGSLGASILLGALLMQGLKPGPEMLTTQIGLTYSMVWMIAIANVVAAILLMLLSQQIARVAFLPGHLIVPGVVLFIFMGAWLSSASMGDWITCLVMAVVGYAMKQGGWPRPPLVLGLILGSIMENTFTISMRAHAGFGWLSRPIVLVIIALILLTIVLAARYYARKGSPSKVAAHPESGEGHGGNVFFSAIMLVLLGFTYIAAGIRAISWPQTVAHFPIMICIFGALLTMLSVRGVFRDYRKEKLAYGHDQSLVQVAQQTSQLIPSLMFFGYLTGLLCLMALVGQKLALTLFVFVYLVRWGNYSKITAGAYALACWAILVSFYDRILNLHWHDSILQNSIPDKFLNWFPGWLVF